MGVVVSEPTVDAPLFLVARSLPVRHGFTLRSGGVSEGKRATLDLGPVGEVGPDVRENRARLARAVGLAPERLALAEQVHGTAVVRGGPWRSARGGRAVDRRARRLDRNPDRGLRPGAPLQPGWCTGGGGAFRLEGDSGPHRRGSGGSARPGGNAAGDAARGHRPGHWLLLLRGGGGPGGSLCRGVRGGGGAPGRSGPHGSTCGSRSGGRWWPAGVPEAHIEDVPGCNACDAGRFFSHRRDRGGTGRHLAFIAPGLVS